MRSRLSQFSAYGHAKIHQLHLTGTNYASLSYSALVQRLDNDERALEQTRDRQKHGPGHLPKHKHINTYPVGRLYLEYGALFFMSQRLNPPSQRLTVAKLEGRYGDE